VALGFGLGIIKDLAIFVGTIVLVLQGESGSAIFEQTFPFCEVSTFSAFVGLIDGFVGGVILGWVYNNVLKWIER
jgi:uncharacterized membrane protein